MSYENTIDATMLNDENAEALGKPHVESCCTNTISERRNSRMSENDVIANQKRILQNQKSILANQSAIKANQETIKKNQASILKNQATLNTIVQNQKKILAKLK
jgi:hypothetical protein